MRPEPCDSHLNWLGVFGRSSEQKQLPLAATAVYLTTRRTDAFPLLTWGFRSHPLHVQPINHNLHPDLPLPSSSSSHFISTIHKFCMLNFKPSSAWSCDAALLFLPPPHSQRLRSLQILTFSLPLLSVSPSRLLVLLSLILLTPLPRLPPSIPSPDTRPLQTQVRVQVLSAPTETKVYFRDPASRNFLFSWQQWMVSPLARGYHSVRHFKKSPPDTGEIF